MSGLVAAVASYLNFPINLRAADLGTISGYALVTSRGEAYLLYDGNSSPMEQDHIIGHELSHLIFGDLTRAGVTPSAAIQALLPDLPVQNLRGVATRLCFADDRERRAELASYRLRQIIMRRQGSAPPPTDADRRLHATFGTRS